MRLQFHHIFPKALLTKSGFQQREADDISNLAFIGGKTNRIISDKPPREYLTALVTKIGPAGFESQKIPLDESLLETFAFKDFLEERRKLISARLNSFISS